MAERRDYVAIDWVLGEISVTVKQACEALEAYIEDPADSTRLRFCQRYTHQIQGTLRMVEFHGAALFAREMELLVKGLSDGEFADRDDAIEVLIASLLQLPPYLERARAARCDLPAQLLPMMNELRTLRGEELLAESFLFSPDLAAARPVLEPQPELSEEEFGELIQNLRQMFQVAFVGIIRNNQLGRNLEYLDKVCRRLYALSQGRAREPLWKITLAVVEGLANQAIEPNSAVKSLLKEIDCELKALLERGSEHLDSAPAETLMKGLLYYVAGSAAGSPLTEDVRREYMLKDALDPSPAGDAGIADASAMKSVVEALVDELAGAKQALDLYARGSGDGETTLSQCIPVLKRVGDTLAVLGLPDVLERIRAQMASLQQIIGIADTPDAAATLLDVAASLVAIEDALQNSALQLAGGEQSAVPHVDEARRAVAQESRTVLERVKEHIIEFVASNWQHDAIEPVSSLLAGIRGTLSLVKFAEAARILWACERYIDDTVRAATIPQWQLLDALADALSSVDYYLERYIEDETGSHEEVLARAVEMVDRLGVPLAEFDAAQLALTESGTSSLLASTMEPSGEEINAPVLIRDVRDAGARPMGADASNDSDASALVPGPVDATLTARQSATELGATSQTAQGVPAIAVEAVVEEVLDPDIAEIFTEEAAEVLQAIAAELPKWRQNHQNSEALDELRRAWHTLKGSGRMVGASIVGELAWSVENLLNRIIDGALATSEQRVGLVERVVSLVPPLVASFAGGRAVNKAYVDQVIEIVSQFVHEVAEPESLMTMIAPEWIDPDAAAVRQPEPIAEEPAGEMTADAETLAAVPPVALPDREILAPDEPAALSDEIELWDIFQAEACQHLEVLNTFVVDAGHCSQPPMVSDELQRALHTLKGSANMAGQMTLAELVTPLEKLVKSHQVSGDPVGPEVLSVLSRTARWLDARLARDGNDANASAEQQAVSVALLEEIVALLQASVARDTEQPSAEQDFLAAVGQFMLDTADRLQSMRDALESPNSEDAVPVQSMTEVAVHCAAIGARAEQLGLSEFAQLARLSEQAASVAATHSLEPAAMTLTNEAIEHFELMLDCLAADQSVAEPAPALLAALQAVVESAGAVREDRKTAASLEPVVDPSLSAEDESQQNDSGGDDLAQIDADVLDIFVEEARDLLENLDDTIHRWQRDADDLGLLDLLKRQLHTLKGSARLVGLKDLGDWSHDFETFVIDTQAVGQVFDGQFFARIQRYQDGVIHRVERVIGLTSQQVASEPLSQAPAPEPLPAAIAGVGDEAMMDVAPSPQAEIPSVASESARQDNQAVKVSASLLDNLVNLAGETSINRGRVYEQVSEVAYSLAEMDATIERMQEQLRRLDRETEAQLMFRQEQVENLGLEEFDPLEMDRYSALQQLSRSLMESSYDVQEVKRTIYNKTRDIETLLAQQSRVNTDLQEGLMRTRMVPFMRMVPRLRRIVRQVSRELSKDVNLVVSNADGEMDRTILERMVPPFEHMLRNAVDHGIESREERLASGKPEQASIAISFEREAGEIVITLADDGRGIDLEAVRAKAIERGLADPDARLKDYDILQFILQPGFSTAQAVTQISGRGVGMDVVSSEIKQLGGSVHIESTAGLGTSFVIRLPFTVSVNRALMVRICGESYALPLNTIEGIVRVSPFELESYYQPGAPLFEYAGQSYALRYMGLMIGRKRLPDLSSDPSPLPVILVRSGDHSVAVQVDSLLGSREIVVKSLGPQFNGVQGLSGATVLGDGGVVVILDLHAMIRKDLSQSLIPHEDSAPTGQETSRENRNTLVMVVDDSVTVRKVTSRFLERNGMDVLLAKDGVDAMRLLQEHTPDVMLLDIEMPRMDGFEVASRIKHSERLEHLPIIMITSRTGQKHRERAEAIGVDRYLGKPYQEMELLRNIDDLIGMTRQSVL